MTKFLSDAERRLDRFELIAELASGGMATVYLARLSGVGGFQRFVAIKRLHPHLANDEEFVQMFLDEARLAARLHHPNVVPILEIGESPQGYYLVMEYVEGDTLARILARSAQSARMLPPQVSLRVCLDAIAGLHVAHELKDDDQLPLHLVHRDVSPQNILIGMDGSGRITDFGVARATTRLSTTRTGQLKGKLAYMAPEQARGSDVDRRADVFAMGIVVWECLAQKRLFKGEGEADTLNRVLYEPIPTCRQGNPEVPPAIEAVVMRALDRERDRRFATASDFGDALEKAALACGWLGNHKDVVAHLESVLGTDISAQRDAVRAWLARSEPSQRLEAHLVANATPSSREVSSVSSAVLQVGDSRPSQATPPPVSAGPPPRRRSFVWLGVAAATVFVGGAGLIAVGMSRKPAAPSAPMTPPVTSVAPPVQPSATVAVVRGSAEPQVQGTADPQSQPVPVSSALSSGRTPGRTHGGQAHGVRTPTAPTVTATAATPEPTATTTTAPDDLSRNPYR